MTTNIWINKIMRDIPGFMGVYSSDNIEDPISLPSYLITNFSGYNSPGSHFITILFIEGICVYFDPLNLSYIPDDILMYMHRNSSYVYRIDVATQHPSSGFCGFYSLLPIMMYVNGISLYDGFHLFQLPSLENDYKCIEILTKLFRLYYFEYSLKILL